MASQAKLSRAKPTPTGRGARALIAGWSGEPSPFVVCKGAGSRAAGRSPACAPAAASTSASRSTSTRPEPRPRPSDEHEDEDEEKEKPRSVATANAARHRDAPASPRVRPCSRPLPYSPASTVWLSSRPCVHASLVVVASAEEEEEEEAFATSQFEREPG